jgi:hemerythrin-like domain-containing protein
MPATRTANPAAAALQAATLAAPAAHAAPSSAASTAASITATASAPAARMRPVRKGRPAHPAAHHPPVMRDRLDGTHRRMLEVLGELEALTRLLDQRKPQPQAAALAQDACAFFGGPARKHHDAEEAEVFPLVVASGDAQLLAHVRRLQQDHNWIEEDWLELEPHLQALAKGWQQEHAAFLLQALPEFTELVQAHITLEETVIYPEARRRRAAQRAA